VVPVQPQVYDTYRPDQFYHLPGQFDVNYIQPIPASPPPVIKAGVTIKPDGRKPFYIHVNPVYPTSDKFDALVPYPQINSISSSPSLSPIPTSTASRLSHYLSFVDCARDK
jgi:hypothetical protein